MAICVMWTSTGAYWIATLLAAVKLQSILHDAMSKILQSVSHIHGCFDHRASGRLLHICPKPTWLLYPFGLMDPLDYGSPAHDGQQCVGTISLMINVSISSVTSKRVFSTQNHAMLSSAMQLFGGAHGLFGASTVSSSSPGLRWYCSPLVCSHVPFSQDLLLVDC